jgi:hypothetical protein
MTGQGDKLREIRLALIAAGFISLDKQAAALGLPRSTTHALLQGNHKCRGLQAGLVARIWDAPALPPEARRILTDYIAARSGGAYGRGFMAQLKKFDLRSDLAEIAKQATGR